MVMELEQVGAQGGARSRQAGPWRWSVALYEQAAGLGWFEGRRVELIDGEIIAMGPVDEPHAVGMNKLQRQFNRKLPDSLFVRGQSPIYVNATSAPEPDIAVVDAALTGQRLSTAHLVVQVSDSTLSFDRTVKDALYASARIAEYWILDVNARALEARRQPIEDALSSSGWRYGWTQTLREGDAVSPLCAPGIPCDVRDMLL